MKFVLATSNPGKIREMREILSESKIEIVTREELGIELKVDETGSTFLENALLKAVAICEASGMPAVSDDSGLMVEALNGEPGVYSSSFGGEDINDSDRCTYLLNVMKNVEQRSAKFVSNIVCAFPNGDTLTALGECHGKIAYTPQGSGGFGYDSVFIANGADKTMAQLSREDKNLVSHRGIALKNFALLLRERGIV